MSSDSTGEIYVLVPAEVTATGGDPTASGTLVTPTATNSNNAGSFGNAIRARAYLSGDTGPWGILLTIVACSVTGFGLLVALPHI